MIVLLLFNQQTSWTVEEIRDRTQIQENLLSPVLASLLEIQLLVSDQIQEINEKPIPLVYPMKLANQFKR